MKLRFTLACMAALALTPVLAQNEGYVLGNSNSELRYINGVSPDGSKAFFTEGTSTEDLMTSTVYDVLNRTYTHVTNYDSDYLDENGRITDINANGTIVGSWKDPAFIAPYADKRTDGTTGEDLMENFPLYSAFIMKNGERINLDHCGYDDPADFVLKMGETTLYPHLVDGFTAVKISPDEKTVLGFMRLCASFYPCIWRLNEATGQYEGELTFIPRNQTLYSMSGVSNDCSTMVWNNKATGGTSYVWRDGDFDTADAWSFKEQGHVINDAIIHCVSPNGKLVGFSCERDYKPAYGVYNLEDDTFKYITMPVEFTSAPMYAFTVVTNEGTGFLTHYRYEAYYFDAYNEYALSLHEYVRCFGLDASPIPSKAIVRGVSEDGRTIVGNPMEYGSESPWGGFLVRLPEASPEIYVFPALNLFYDTPQSLTVTFQPVNPRGETTVKEYVVTIAGNTYTLTGEELDENGCIRLTAEVNPGVITSVNAYAVMVNGDNEFNTLDRTETIQESANTELFFIEDNDNATLIDNTGYVYNNDNFFPKPGNDSGVQRWFIDTAALNDTPFWCTYSISGAKWESILESRWFDATDARDFYLSYLAYGKGVNDTGIDDSNTFMAEYSTDGEHWTTINTVRQKSANTAWNAYFAPLTDVEGKYFKIRFRAAGPGYVNAEWQLDYIAIRPNSEMLAAPADLLLVENDKYAGIKLAWKNPIGAYEVSYNTPVTHTYTANVGNAGDPLQVACDYTPDKLEPYVGMYITSVSTMVYDPMEYEQAVPTKTEAIVYDEDLNELSRGLMTGPYFDQNVDLLMPNQVIYLEKPVLIEPGATYRVALRISEYQADVCPIWYQSISDDDYIPGVTDLYSDEDDGLTWKSLSDLYADADESSYNAYGRCVFNIRPGITTEAEVERTEFPQKAWFYEVYRNGEPLKQGVTYYTQLSAIDPEPSTSGNSYTVRRFDRDGKVSQLSQPLYVDWTSVEEILGENISDLEVSCEDGLITINGDYDKATLYNLQGAPLGRVRNGALALPTGLNTVCILVVEKDGKRMARKFIIR